MLIEVLKRLVRCLMAMSPRCLMFMLSSLVELLFLVFYCLCCFYCGDYYWGECE